MKYVCELCGYVYQEQIGEPARKIAPGTAFSQLPEDYTCPHCGCGREAFDPVGQAVKGSAGDGEAAHSQR